MKSLFKYLRRYRAECILSPLFKLLEVVFELGVPLIVANIVDQGIANADQTIVVRSCLILFGMAAVGLTVAILAQYFAAKAAIGTAAGIRHALMEKIQSMCYSDIDRFGPSTLITRMTGDVNQVQNGVNLALRLVLRSPFVVFGAMIMAFSIDSQIAMIFVAVIAVLFAIVFGILFVSMPMQRKAQGMLDGVTSATRSNLTGVRVIRAFCKEEDQTEKFNVLNERVSRAQLLVGRVTAALNPLTYVAVNVAIILLLRSGAVRIDAGTLTQGQVIALYNYLTQILVELVKLANLVITLTRSAACMHRVADVLDSGSAMRDGERMPENAEQGYTVEFEDVTMRYHETGDPALEHISFTALPGETVGVIGGTGSGKTSLVNLIPRFYDVSGGRVTVNGTDVRELNRKAYTDSIAVVPQKSVLFRGTIRSNLLWGNPEATDEELMRAVSLAQATDVIKSKKEGLDAAVEQGGQNFSGGQRQRLAIARALVRKPRILILDDSASALDFATDAALRKSIRTMSPKPLMFVVSQRTSSVRAADKIIVMEDGRCVGCGSHDELLDTCPVYREIHMAQLGGEGAAAGE